VGGVSTGDYASWNLGAHVGDDPAAVAENRRRLHALLPAEPLWLNQVHGVAVADADACGAGVVPTADAAITRATGRVLAVLSADCLPVVLGDVEGQVLGLAHAGWRGLAHGVLEHTLQSLRLRCPQAQGWRAWVGPAISARGFEVGREVLDAFVAVQPQAAACFHPAGAAAKFFADLPGLATLRLRAAGVDHVQGCAECTFSHPERYFSYRQQGRTGRIVTCAWRT